MKAVVLHEYGGPEKLKYEDWDDPVAGEGELLVRVTATSVNPFDYKVRRGVFKDMFPLQFPTILGSDISGVVMGLGPGVSGFAPGDKVMVLSHSAYAEMAAVKAADTAHIPEGLDPVKAAALPVVTQTGEQLFRATKAKEGQTVLITGALGNVGRSAVWAAKRAGATVIAGVRGSQVKMAEALGVAAVVAVDDAKSMEKLGFIDAVADTVGGELAALILAKVRPGGVFASVVGSPSNAKLHPTISLEAIRVLPDAAMLRTAAEAVAAGQFEIPIDRMVPLSEADKAHAAAEKGGIGKVLLLA